MAPCHWRWVLPRARSLVRERTLWGLADGRGSLRGKHCQSLFVVTAYQVAQKTTKNLGHKTAAYQQVLLLTEQRENPETEIAPRRQMIKDLTSQILKWQQNHKCEILVMIDANETMAEGSLIEVLTSTCNLQDVHKAVHPDTIHLAPASHNTGLTRIDYLLGSPKVIASAVRAGITDFQDIVPSDHRGLFVDLDRGTIFGSQWDNPSSYEARVLHSKDPEKCYQYKQELWHRMGKMNALTRMEQIEHLIAIGEAKQATHELNNLDDEITTAMKLSERHCGKRHKTTPWSPKLKEWGRKVRYWRKRLNMRTRNFRPTMDLFHIAKEYNLPHPYQRISIQDIKTNLDSTSEQLKEVRAKAAEVCRQHLLDRAEAMAKAGIMDKEAAIKCILRAEEMRQKEGILKVIFKSRQSNSLTALLIPDQKDQDKPPDKRNWIWIRNGQEIDENLVAYNRQHFSQA